MGYRSEVIFGVKKDSRDKMDKVLEEHDLQKSFKWYEKTYDFTEFDKLNNHKVKRTEYWIIYIGDWLKWYDVYDDVLEVHRCINHLNEDGFMVALGEDNVIHSERGEWCDYVNHISKLEII